MWKGFAIFVASDSWDTEDWMDSFSLSSHNLRPIFSKYCQLLLSQLLVVIPVDPVSLAAIALITSLSEVGLKHETRLAELDLERPSSKDTLM